MSESSTRRSSSAVVIWRRVRVGLFLATVACAVTTRDPWVFGAVFAFGLSGVLDAAREEGS